MTEIDHEIKRIHLFITGKVQGVGFRAFVQQTAVKLGLTGWVRNVGYDQVETVAEGNPVVLEYFVKAVRSGPRSSRVDELNFGWEVPLKEFDRFEIRF
jgi:acylphosphatase